MKFIHEPADLGYNDLEAVTGDKGRFYTDPEGNKYASVTTVLSILSEEAKSEHVLFCYVVGVFGLLCSREQKDINKSRQQKTFTYVLENPTVQKVSRVADRWREERERGVEKTIGKDERYKDRERVTNIGTEIGPSTPGPKR